MKIDEFEEKTINSKNHALLQEQIIEFLELFSLYTKVEKISLYKYDYEYNEFFYNFSLDEKQELEKIENIKEEGNLIYLQKDELVYGYIKTNEEVKTCVFTQNLLEKITLNLKKQKELEKNLLESDSSFNIYLIHDEELKEFASNLSLGLKGLFNTGIYLSSSISTFEKALKSKESKHIIIYLIEDEKQIKTNKEFLKTLNELIIVIGPNNHNTSIYCGKLGIENYISINEFKAEDIKDIIINTRKKVLNKNRFDNKIIALSGISGGVGTTSIAMNMADLLAKNLPNKNILFIDLSTTKAVSNLFLTKDPLPSKTIIDLINTNEFNLDNNLENGLSKIKENFYFITGIQKHLDSEYLQKDAFIEKLLDYIVSSSEYFNYIIIDLGQSDSSNLKTTIYDLVNELWLVTQMNLPHISKLKTFYSLLKRAGLKEKVTFLVNRYDSANAISVNDVTSILNMNSQDRFQFDDFKIPNDYKNLGRCWNYCELVSSEKKDSSFIEKLDSILEEKQLYKKSSTSESWFSKLFKKA